jgi:hypothetical protein
VEDCGEPIWGRGAISLTSTDGYDYEQSDDRWLVRRVEEQGLLRWQPRVDQIQGEGEETRLCLKQICAPILRPLYCDVYLLRNLNLLIGNHPGILLKEARKRKDDS